MISKPDLLIIGGGPGGYAAAIRASQLGLSTVCVEKEKLLGGVCLREGCVPSKFLLNFSHNFFKITHNFPHIGISFNESPKANLDIFQQKKNKLMNDLSDGIRFLLEKNKVIFINGKALIHSKNKISVNNQSFHPKNLLLATGSSFVSPFPLNKNVMSSREILNITKIPKSLVVIGGGIIGLELGSAFAQLGSHVSVVHPFEKIGVDIDPDASTLLETSLKRIGMKFFLNRRANSVTQLNNLSQNVTLNDGTVINADSVLVATKRTPNLSGFEPLKLQLKDNFIFVNEKYETSVKNVYAIGDLIPGKMLAHKAQADGVAVAEILAGFKPKKKVIPTVLYTSPEIAQVGDVFAKGKVAKFPYRANSRARISGESEGFVKFVVDMNEKIVSMTVVGPNAGEAIVEGAIAIENGLSIDAIANTVHPHPSLSESVMEAAKMIKNTQIHI